MKKKSITCPRMCPRREPEHAIPIFHHEAIEIVDLNFSGGASCALVMPQEA